MITFLFLYLVTIPLTAETLTLLNDAFFVAFKSLIRPEE